MTEPLSETDAYLTLSDARGGMGFPTDLVGTRHEVGWSFHSAEKQRTYVVTDAGGVDRVGPSEDPQMAIERLS